MDQESLTRQERRALRREEKNSDHARRSRGRFFRRVGLWGGVLLLIGLGAWGMVRFVTADPLGAKMVLLDAVSPTDWVGGSPAARHILVEYSDFQCPACGLYYPIVKQLTTEYGDRVRFVYRHFPLAELHRNAQAAAYAAEAAGAQGKFWEMHDKLFSTQDEWGDRPDAPALFREYAQELGLAVDQFSAAMDGGAVRDEVERDYQSGLRSGLNSTPTFFLDGKRIANPRGYTDFKDALDAALSRANEDVR